MLHIMCLSLGQFASMIYPIQYSGCDVSFVVIEMEFTIVSYGL